MFQLDFGNIHQREEFKPSHYQQAIFNFVKTGRGDGVVDAVPGSGKTTTLVQAARYIKSDRALFVAFNKHIAEELQKKLSLVGSTMQASTLHSLGYRAIKGAGLKPQLDPGKYDSLCKQEVIEQGLFPDKWSKTRPTAAQYETLLLLKKLVNLSQLTLNPATSEQNLLKMAYHYIDIEEIKEEEIWPLAWPCVKPVLETGKNQVDKWIDFNDQIWLPNVVEEIKPPQFDWVFADECQDFNAAQLGLVLQTRASGGRMLFVGDKRQSIYGFIGADTQSFQKITKQTKATVLPLSICYRCPKSHVEMAARIYPGIEAAPEAGAGEITTLAKYDDLIKEVQEGDLIICRITSHLITACFGLIRSGIAARVKGRDIGNGLVALLRQMEKKFGEIELWQDFPFYLASYQSDMISRAKEADQVILLTDKIETIQALYESAPNKPTSIGDFQNIVNQIFSDDKPSVWLSTIHKAKGLEADRIFILGPELLSMNGRHRKDWEWEQEKNVEYVAYTRAKQTLFLSPVPTTLAKITR